MIITCLLALAMLATGPDPVRPGDASTPPVSAEADLARADSAYAAGHDDEARAAYRSVLSRDPESVRANHRLGLLLSRLDRLDSALVLVGRARAAEPNDAGVLVTEARLLSWAGRLSESIADYDAVLARDPRHREARLGRARVLGWAGRYASADSAYAALLADDPNDVEAMTGRAQNDIWRGQRSLAEAEFIAALRHDGDNVDALIGLARLRHDQGDQRSAATQVSRALTLDPRSRIAMTLRDEIRAAQRPQVDFGFGMSQDSDHNVSWSRTLSTSLALGEGLRAFLAGGSLAANDPVLDATRTFGEAGLEASHGPAQATLAAGARWLDPSAGPGRSMPSYRSSLTFSLLGRLTAAAGFAHYPMDETAALIGSGLELDEFAANAEAQVGHGIALSADGAAARLSDGNRRASGLAAAMRSFGRLGSVGVLGRVLSYERHGAGYFSPDRFALAEARGTLALTRRAWSGRLNGGLGSQQVGVGAAGQLAWRGAAQLKLRWGPVNYIETSVGASNSAASSSTGAYRYMTAAVALRLGL